jgi:hypothetical protein
MQEVLMARKRTDQWTGEAGATDHKTHPQDGQDAAADDRKFSEVMEGRFARSQPIAPKVLDPEAERARSAELERQEHIRGKKAPRARRSKRK